MIMNRYKQFEAAVFELAGDFPEARIESRSLRGTCDEDDQLILERRVGRDLRIVFMPISSESEPVTSFYWGYLPPPGESMLEQHGEGNLYGNDDYKLYFIRAFLLEFRDWEEISHPNLDGSPFADPEHVHRLFT
jgi:hypothetical protein